MMKRLMIGAITVGFTIFLLTGCFNTGVVEVNGLGMAPTIQDEDQLGVDKDYY